MERMRFSVTQLDRDFTQLKECMEKTTSNICCVTTRLKELDDLLDLLRNEIDQMKETNPKSRKKRGILKRAHEEADDEYQPRTSTRRVKKKLRVTWQG
jgi:chromosome segregation ATPase